LQPLPISYASQASACEANQNSNNNDSGMNWGHSIHGHHQHLKDANSSSCNMNDDLLMQAPVLEFQASMASIDSDMGRSNFGAYAFDERNIHNGVSMNVSNARLHPTAARVPRRESLLDDDDDDDDDHLTNNTRLERDVTNFFNNIPLNRDPSPYPHHQQ
jgi:hypothetical protein